jgi:hypothetical protein
MSAPVLEATVLAMLIRRKPVSGMAERPAHSQAEAREERAGWFWD